MNNLFNLEAFRTWTQENEDERKPRGATVAGLQSVVENQEYVIKKQQKEVKAYHKASMKTLRLMLESMKAIVKAEETVMCIAAATDDASPCWMCEFLDAIEKMENRLENWLRE